MTPRTHGSGHSLQGRATIVGTGLIGGSLGLALRANGWHVQGVDREAVRAEEALRLGVLDAVGYDEEAELVVLATPARAVVEEARAVLERPGPPGRIVTDVAGVKGRIAGRSATPASSAVTRWPVRSRPASQVRAASSSRAPCGS